MLAPYEILWLCVNFESWPTVISDYWPSRHQTTRGGLWSWQKGSRWKSYACWKSGTGTNFCCRPLWEGAGQNWSFPAIGRPRVILIGHQDGWSAKNVQKAQNLLIFLLQLSCTVPVVSKSENLTWGSLFVIYGDHIYRFGRLESLGAPL